MKCVSCGKGKLTHKVGSMPYTYKNQTTVIHNIEGDYCDNCDEVVMGHAAGARVSEEMLQFNKLVNATAVNPSFIVSVRKKLKLNQQQAAEIFGGGVNAFSRYEKGLTNPPLALVQLFKILDHHPDLLAEIKQNSLFKKPEVKTVARGATTKKPMKKTAPKKSKPLLKAAAKKRVAKKRA